MSAAMLSGAFPWMEECNSSSEKRCNGGDVAPGAGFPATVSAGDGGGQSTGAGPLAPLAADSCELPLPQPHGAPQQLHSGVAAHQVEGAPLWGRLNSGAPRRPQPHPGLSAGAFACLHARLHPDVLSRSLASVQGPSPVSVCL